MKRLADQFAVGDAERAAVAPDAIAIADKTAASAALQRIEGYYARSEPSSPIPFLCERARKLMASDFLTILREILPDDALKFHE
jgi:type VI secretion system protein ImpA